MEEQKPWSLLKPKGLDPNRCEIKPKTDDKDSVEGYVVEVH
jgi:hypothetical protein